MTTTEHSTIEELLTMYEAVLFDSYKILLELKEVWEQGTPKDKHIIVQMAMIKAKIVIIKKKIRDL